MKNNGEKINMKLPESIGPLVGAVETKVQEALKSIDIRINNPTDQVAENLTQLSTNEQLISTIKNYYKESGKILWTDTKANIAGILSLIPFLGPSMRVADVTLVEAAILEGATKAQAEALAKGAVVTASGEVAYPLIKILGKEGAERFRKIMEKIDPYPDVPISIVAASGVASIGLAGGGAAAGASGIGGPIAAGMEVAAPIVAAIPAAGQILIDKYKFLKLSGSTGKKVFNIIYNSPKVQEIKERITDRLKAASSPKMAAAAQAFA